MIIDWSIPLPTRAKYTQLFNTTDTGRTGFISGAQARVILLQSGLPQKVLASIWALADVDVDGRLTLEEFILANHLIECVQRGEQLPTALPPDLIPPSQRKPSAVTTPVLTEWAIPQPSKLKYTQLFNYHDRTRTGYLTGAQAKNILLQSGLPQQLLAQIWALADVDVDGRLTCDEFVLATHLIDMVKAGTPLPTVLPPDLIPPSLRRRSSSGSQSALAAVGPATSVDLIGTLDDIGSAPSSRKGSVTTFEDKRRENFEKGQAELDRRRQMLLDQQRRQQEERERKEREEFEKREKIRLEQEKRKQQEMERQLQKQRELEAAKEEERRKQLELREAARREMERQRMIEWENQRKQELLNQEQETAAQLKNKKKSLMIDYEQVCNQFNLLQEQVNDTRKKVADSKSDIDKMRSERDVKLKEINFLKAQMKTLQDRQLLIEQDKINLSAQLKDLTMNNVTGITDSAQFALQNKKIKISQLKTQIEECEKEREAKIQDMQNKSAEFKELKEKFEALVGKVKTLQEGYDRKLVAAKDLVAKGVPERKVIENAWDDQGDAWNSVNDNAWPTTNTNSNFDAFPTDFSATFPSATATTTTTNSDSGTKYRVVFAFEARSQDELTIQDGDIVIVRPDPTAAPGWLQGELNGKIGWFPEAYVEPLEPTSGFAAPTSSEFPSQMTSDNGFGAQPGTFESARPTDTSGFSDNMTATTTSTSEPYIDISARIFPLNAVVLYHWSGTEPSHLTINRGDIISVKQHKDDWLLGEIVDRKGWFPKSFVKPIAGSVASEADLEPIYHVAMYPFQSQEVGDLAFEGGEIIKVVKKEGDWWTGEIDPTRIGIFPSNYVREASVEELPLPSGFAPQLAPPVTKNMSLEKGKLKKPEIVRVIAPYKATGPEQLSLEKDQLIQVRKKNTSGWWEGETQVKGQKRQIGWFPASYVKSLSGSAAGSGGSSARSTPDPNRAENESIEKVISLYPFAAQQDDELSFQANEVIKVLSKEDPTWWKGQLESSNAIGVFPSNYVQSLADANCNRYESPIDLGSQLNQFIATNGSEPTPEDARQKPIQEFIVTEEVYVHDLKIVIDVFERPLRRSNTVPNESLNIIFLNWSSLLEYNSIFLKALIDRRSYYLQNCDGAIEMIGDVIVNHIPGMVDIYIGFCSHQLKAAKLLQKMSETDEHFREAAKKCSMNRKTNGLPLGAYLLKPMQRITKYPLVIKKILSNTPSDHPDRAACERAYEMAQSLCDSVNEACRSQENEERLDWIQTHVKCDGIDQIIRFNSMTKFMGPRLILNSGYLIKVNSGKELVAFLFNDFLLLTVPVNQSIRFNNLWASDKGLSNAYRMYKRPILLNDMELVDDLPTSNGSRSHSTPLISSSSSFSALSLANSSSTNASSSTLSSTSSSESQTFILKLKSSDRTYTFKATSHNERNNWIKAINSAKREYAEKLGQRKSYFGLSDSPGTGIGRLLVTVLEAVQLFTRNETLNSYCRVSVGDKFSDQSSHRQVSETKVARSCFPMSNDKFNSHGNKLTLFTANWNYSMQFILKDPLQSSCLSISCFDEDPFAPDLLIGQTSIALDDLSDEISRTTARPLTKAYKLKSIDKTIQDNLNSVVYLKLDLLLF